MQAPPPLQPGQQPTPQQIQMIQQQFLAEAARQGLTPQQFGEKLKAMQQQRMQAQGQTPGQAPPPGGGGPTPQQIQQMQQAQQQQQQVPIQPGPPKPEAIAIAKFLRSQNLKSRACIFQEKRKELFKGMFLNIFFFPTHSNRGEPSCAHKADILLLQSNAQSVLSNPPPTRKPAQKTSSCPP